MPTVANVQHNENTASGLTISVTLNSVQAGSTLLLFYSYNTNGDGATISDGVNTWGFVEGVSTLGNEVGFFRAINVGANNYTLTMTQSNSNPATFRGIVGVEVRGVPTSDPIGAQHKVIGVSAPGTGTDAVTTGNVSINQGALVIGVCRHFDQNSNLAVGTGFTSDLYVTAPDFMDVLVEHKTHSGGTGNDAATFTDSNGGGGMIAMIVGLNSGQSNVPRVQAHSRRWRT